MEAGDVVAYIAQFWLGGQGEPRKAHASLAMTAESHWSGPTLRRFVAADIPMGSEVGLGCQVADFFLEAGVPTHLCCS